MRRRPSAKGRPWSHARSAISAAPGERSGSRSSAARASPACSDVTETASFIAAFEPPGSRVDCCGPPAAVRQVISSLQRNCSDRTVIAVCGGGSANLALSFVAALFVIGFVRSGWPSPSRSDRRKLDDGRHPRTDGPAADRGAAAARPQLRQHAISVLRAWIGRRRDWPVVPLPA